MNLVFSRVRSVESEMIEVAHQELMMQEQQEEEMAAQMHDQMQMMHDGEEVEGEDEDEGQGEDKDIEREPSGSSVISHALLIRHAEDREITTKAKFEHAIAEIEVSSLPRWVLSIAI